VPVPCCKNVRFAIAVEIRDGYGSAGNQGTSGEAAVTVSKLHSPVCAEHVRFAVTIEICNKYVARGGVGRRSEKADLALGLRRQTAK
jgi:hypothetical protein